jgi:hypothetical protein
MSARRELSALPEPAPGVLGGAAQIGGRALFVALLVAAPLLPQFGNSLWTYPAVSNFWVYLPFCALFLLALVDVHRLARLFHLDLLALLCFGAALAFWRKSNWLALLCTYAPLAYLCVRMATLARIGKSEQPSAPSMTSRTWLPAAWLIAGIVVLVAVHVNWTLGGQANTDVGPASVKGALDLLHGQPLYGISHATLVKLGADPHLDTYGPALYELYVPFASVAGAITAARLAALFFDLLTAALLFALGRELRGGTTGVTLAFAWLAFPITFYAGGLAANDSLVSATIVGTLLVARSPVRRGVMAAVTAWTKLSPLALLPVLLGHSPSAHDRRRTMTVFIGAFALATAPILAPALVHGSVSTFVTRTFGYQLSRPPGFSIWERLNMGGFPGAAWLEPASKVAHGLLVALAGTFAVALLWMPRRRDLIGLAGACAAVLIAVQLCDGYYSLTYVLWFAPLVLVTSILARDERPTESKGDGSEARADGHRGDQPMTVSSLGRLVSTS